MTTSESLSPARDLAWLDGRIAGALGALRLARVASARGPTAGSLLVEARAEADLNDLLEHRLAVVLAPPP
jgi:hypothetical protein